MIDLRPFQRTFIKNATRPEDILGADRGTKNHLPVSSGHSAHNPKAGEL